jgi:Cu-Zn family superoxide dismutase
MPRSTFDTTMVFLVAATLVACGDTPDDASPPSSEPVTLRAVDSGTAPDSLVAAAELRDRDGRAAGEARLFRRGSALVVHIEAVGLEPGSHGAHIHETGACTARQDFESAGAHLNPDDVTHGLHSPSGGHAGDLPNLEVDADGSGSLRFETTDLSIGARPGDLFDRDGSALVIHAGPDDQITDPSGNSGDRVACGVLEET